MAPRGQETPYSERAELDQVISRRTVHLVLFDGECPLCSRAVLFLLRWQLPEMFLFASQFGETAALLQSSPLYRQALDGNSLALLLNWGNEQQQLLRGARALSILLCALPNRFLRVLGWIVWLTRPLSTVLYWMVARIRRWLPLARCSLPAAESSARFLP